MLESLFNKVAGLEGCKFIKERLQQRCFPVNIAEFLRTVLFTKDLQRLLLLCDSLFEDENTVNLMI